MHDFKQRVAVITGAGSGIGRALALQLASEGAKLALADKSAEGLAATQALLGDNVLCLCETLDVADRQAVDHFAEKVNAHFGSVDALFNNAGVTLVDSIEEQSLENFNWVMNINFWGVVYCTQAFLPALRKSDQACIVNISSVFGLLSVPLQSAYNSSKFAVRGFTEALKMELAGSTISVHCVHPGGIKTGIADNSRMNTNVVGNTDKFKASFTAKAKTSPQDAASIILRGVKRGKRRILVGKDAHIMSLLTRLFPGSYEKLMGLEKAMRRKNTV